MSDIDKLKPYLGDDAVPGKGMRYAAQVIWLLDPSNVEMSMSANSLHAKRVAAGEGDKCQIVSGMSPTLVKQLPRTDNIRLYVVGHGAEVIDAATRKIKKFGIQMDSSFTEQSILAHVEFRPYLKSLVEQMPLKKVTRVALFMCNSAGLEQHIETVNSFGKLLADLCADLTTDVTGRKGSVHSYLTEFKKSDVDNVAVKLKITNPFQTMVIRNVEQSITNVSKEVRNCRKTGTYVFQAGSPPQLKLGYHE